MMPFSPLTLWSVFRAALGLVWLSGGLYVGRNSLRAAIAIVRQIRRPHCPCCNGVLFDDEGKPLVRPWPWRVIAFVALFLPFAVALWPAVVLIETPAFKQRMFEIIRARGWRL